MTWLPWIISGASLLTGAVAVIYLRWRLQKAEDGEHVWHTKANQLVRDMTDLVAAANDRDRRRIGVTRVARAQLDVATASAADAALADPAAADRFVRDSLRQAAAATDPSLNPDLPRPAAADAPDPGDRGGHR